MNMYIEEDFGKYEIKKIPYSFFRKDGRCEIEACKPESCKGYLFTDRPERIISLTNIIESASVCHVVFEMIESQVNIKTEDRSIRMSNINNTIDDFKKFIEFIKNEKPILSGTKEVLGRRDCYNLNVILANKKDLVNPSYNQDKYFAIELMFSLVLASKLYIKANDEKGKVGLFKADKLESFQNLNEDEKYIFLLQTY